MKKSKPKVKEKKKDEENFDYMKTNKIILKILLEIMIYYQIFII
jgi:hypothetical protein